MRRIGSAASYAAGPYGGGRAFGGGGRPRRLLEPPIARGLADPAIESGRAKPAGRPEPGTTGRPGKAGRASGRKPRIGFRLAQPACRNGVPGLHAADRGALRGLTRNAAAEVLRRGAGQSRVDPAEDCLRQERDKRGAEANEGDEGQRVGHKACQSCEDAAKRAIRDHHRENAPEHHVDEVKADPRHDDRGDQTDNDQGGPDQQAEHEDVPPTAVPDERGGPCRKELGDKPDRHRDHGFDHDEEPADRRCDEVENRQERQHSTDHEGDHEQRDRGREKHGRRDARGASPSSRDERTGRASCSRYEASPPLRVVRAHCRSSGFRGRGPARWLPRAAP